MTHADPLGAMPGARVDRDRRQHAGGVFLLPQHLEKLDLLAAATHGRDVDLARHRTPLRRQPMDRAGRQDDLAGLRLAGHAVRRVHRRAEDVLVLEHDGPVMTADADCDVLALHREFRVRADVLLHLTRGVHGIVGGGKDGEDLVANGLDHRAPVALRRVAHQPDAIQDHVPGLVVAEQLIQARAAHHVREQDGDFRFVAHRRGLYRCGPVALSVRRRRGARAATRAAPPHRRPPGCPAR